MPDELTPQAKGYAWEKEVAQRFGGKETVGSGNRNYARLDVQGEGFVISAKHTIHKSFSVTQAIIDDARSVTMGPNGVDPSIIPIIAVRLEETETDVIVMEMDALIEWLRSPPQIIQPTKTDELRAQAKRDIFEID